MSITEMLKMKIKLILTFNLNCMYQCAYYYNTNCMSIRYIMFIYQILM